jgi:protein phosphatase
MKITIPELSLIVFIGASGSGKSSLARKHFQPTEVISSDYCRALISDNENDQSISKQAFEVVHFIATQRLKLGKLTAIDATNVQKEARKPLLQLARQYHVFPVAIVLDIPEKTCQQSNQTRPDRDFGSHVVARHSKLLKQSLRSLEKEGFRYVFHLKSEEEVETLEIERQPLWNDKKHETGAFDIIGDIHGCSDELEILLEQLGYKTKTETLTPDRTFWDAPTYYHPEGRRLIFLGDLVDRGARILDTMKIVRNAIVSGNGFCVAGNHDNKLLRKLKGRNVNINHGLAESIAEIESLPETIKTTATQEIQDFLESLVSHYVLDEGKLVVAHAGLKEELQGRGSKSVREFALYGETTGEIDEFGLPVRLNWASEYRGKAMVAYGHTPVPEATWLNNTIDLDTGCVFGGKLTALRYPERELVSVDAFKVYCEPVKPLTSRLHSTLKLSEAEALTEPTTNFLTPQQQVDDILDISDVLGKKVIHTAIQPQIIVREENSVTALEIMSRFAANPKWLIYLPPTMSPVATSHRADFLEYPTEAFNYYQEQGINEVICEEKHMGSRAIVIVCQNENVARQRFGVVGGEIGICYTRTGRKFFDSPSLEAEFLSKVKKALTDSDFWVKLTTDWVCLDCELMPWSAKARELLRQQYAAVGVASQVALNDATTLLSQAAARGIDVTAQLQHYQQRQQMAADYVKAYRRYCWSVDSLADLKLAPFHILATEKAVHTDKSHIWHMETIAEICAADLQLLLATNYKTVNLQDSFSIDAATNWWEELTAAGGEGMVVKPKDFLSKGKRGWMQPAVKCRGREYLRIIYGAEYTAPEQLEQLRQRGLSHKRSLAMREFALSVEALQRFIECQPLRQVHECVFAILAMESEPVDPRL